LSMAIFYQIFPPGQRGMAVGFSLMGWSIGPSIGPLLGGYLVQFASWRVIYVMILPIAGIAFLLAWWFLPTLQRPARRRLDHYGLFTMAIFVSTLILGLSRGNREGWDSQYILTLLAIAGVSGLIFIVIELCHSEPSVELHLYRHFPFVMAICVTFLTTMAFRSTGPMIPVLMQRLLGFEPLQVAWTLMPANIIYGITVLTAGRLADRLSPQFLVVMGLLIYASAFANYAGINESVTAAMMTTFLIFRFIAEGFIVGPNNLTALQALPEDRVMMAAGLMGLIRSIANILGASMAAVVWDARFARHLQQFADNAPIDAFGLAAMMREVHNALVWAGEIATQASLKTLAIIHRRLLAEASTAAWQDYLLFNAVIALVTIIPALLVNRHLVTAIPALLVNRRIWRHARPAVPAAQAVETPTQR